jgi:hypothetical protein
MEEIQQDRHLNTPSDLSLPAGIVTSGIEVQVQEQDRSSRESDSLAANDDVDADSAIDFIRNYMDTRQIEVLFDGSLFLRGRPLQADTPEDVDAFLAVDPPSASDLLDEALLFAQNSGVRFKKTELSAALRQVVRAEKNRRLQAVMGPLLKNWSPLEHKQANEVWARIGGLFDMDRGLAIAVLQHFCWSVKQKQLGRLVAYHCMPIIFSPEQGTGKTVFVKKFLSPLRELATDSTLFSDLADRRSGDVFRFPVIFLDDMEEIPSSMVPVLKAVLTSDKLRRRRLGTSSSDGIRQASVPIGTSNQMIHQLVRDDTGHRRFVMLPFRSGAVAKGGDANVWEAVNSTNYELLWRSVNAFAQSPLVPYLKDLHQYQGATQREGGLLEWLLKLDLESEPVRNLTTRHGLKARELRNLFMAQTGAELSDKRFADEMDRCLLHPDAPFYDKVKTETGAVYRLKRRPTSTHGQQQADPLSQVSPSSLSASSGPSFSTGSGHRTAH